VAAVDVHIWWIGADAPDDTMLEDVRKAVERAFGLRVRRYHHADRPTHAFDARRGQHSSSQILKWLADREHPAGRIVAVTDVDLFIPVLTYVYGEAQLGGRAAVMSTARLTQDLQAVTNPALRVARAVKETVHELGHTFGLLHCDQASCVMSRSVSLIDVDGKTPLLCARCAELYGERRRKEGHDE
jgi:archaemetzincin